MQIVQRERLIDQGEFSSTPVWSRIGSNILQAIRSIQWPPGSGAFIIYPQSGKKRGEGNGVKPIKDAFILHLVSQGWSKEHSLKVLGVGDIDAGISTDKGLFGAEWETGNVSSSHRAINKMVMGIEEGVLIGGVLIVPTKQLAQYLTDRIGNFPELKAYFPHWRRAGGHIEEGLLEIIAIEQDGTSWEVPRIEKGTDGRALA